MNLAAVEPIVSATLYEGYLLYPYRPSALKNRQRWTFGGIFPPAFCQGQAGDASSMQVECLLQAGPAADPAVEVRVRFLHLIDRGEGSQRWQEAVEREVAVGPVSVAALAERSLRQAFACPAAQAIEPASGSAGSAGLVRRQQALAGLVTLAAAQVAPQTYRLTLRVANTTPLAEPALPDRAAAQLCSFASTHCILAAEGGDFVSLFDPPAELAEATAGLDNSGCWPVLVGEAGSRAMMLAAPIILYDYPQVAAESPGDLFDGTEIDEILTLRILTMTDDEKREMCAADERARALLERTEALDREALMRLHGTIRELRPAREEQ